MNTMLRPVRLLFGGCALGLAGLVVFGCSDGTSDGPNLLPMTESPAAADGQPAATGSVGSKRHGGQVAKAPATQHLKGVAEDGDLSAKELRAKKLKAKGPAEDAQP